MPIRIVLVSDEAEGAREASGVLERLGHVVTLTRSGEEVREAMAPGGAALVLLDAASAGVDVFAIAGAIRAGDEPRPPLVFLRADGAPDGVVRAWQQGAAGVLVGPVIPEAIGATVTPLIELVRRREAERAGGGAGLAALRRELAAARQQEQRWREIFDAIEPGVFVIEMIFDEERRPVDYRILLLNAAYEKQTGNAHEIGKTRRELSSHYDTHWIELYGRVALTGEPAHAVNRSLAASGRWFEVHAFRLGGPGSHLVAGLFTDISARHRAEEALRRTQQRLEATLRAGEVSTWTWDVREDRVFADRNLAQLFGVSAFDAHGGPIAAYLKSIHHADRERVNALIRRTLEGGEPYQAEFRVRRPDGELRSVIARGRAEYDDESQRLWMPGVVLDITHQRSIEEALRRSEARLQFTLKAGRMGTWERNLETGVLVVSDTCKANFGRAPDDPFTFDDLTRSVLDEDRALWTERVEEATRTATDLDTEFRLRWPDGSLHWVQVRASCTAFSPESRTLALSGVSLLIDDRKRVEEELKAADRQKDEFLATASHELRTPLNAILGWARLLRSGQLDPSGYLRGIETIERNAKSQVQLIEDILDGSRIITGKLHLEVRPLDLTVLVGAALDAIRPAAEAKRIALSVALDPGASRVLGDPERLQQIVWNLANNAIKFTPKGGYVDVRLERAGSRVELTIEDSGQGIRADFLPHVFERFRQAEGSTTRRHGGLGLGLALVHHLVEAHGGTVRAESAGEGRGAKFIVSLPFQASLPQGPEPEPSRPPAPSDPGLPPARLEGVTVLVVDDEADARDLVATVLRAHGAEVTTAPSAERGLELVSQISPMVLISDIGMPETDGYELIRRVRTLTGLQGARLSAIALTAYAREEDRRRALEAGFQTHVAKPVEPADLVRVVASLVQPLPRDSSLPGYDTTIGRADTLAKFDRILEIQGVRGALYFLNSRTPHRFTGLFRLDPPLLRTLHLVDAFSPAISAGGESPLSEAYCAIVGETEQSFTTEDTRRDDRLRNHPIRDKVLSYCGVLLRDEEGRPFGTLCHYDLVPCEVPVVEMSILEAVAPRLLRALRAAAAPPEALSPAPGRAG